LKSSSLALAALPVSACVARPFPVRSPYWSAIPADPADTLVNDIHSQLNATRVDSIVMPTTVQEVQAAVRNAVAAGRSVSVAGGRHAMGGQQFGEASVLVDTRALKRVLDFDSERGVITVQGGIQWPELLDHLNRTQTGQSMQWGIYQKQTGADRLSIAGALACNAHGRGLNLKPIVFSCYQPVPDETPLTVNPTREFLTLKRQHDPGEVFQSNWYRHYRDMFLSGSSP
jgi:FAD binding domain